MAAARKTISNSEIMKKSKGAVARGDLHVVQGRSNRKTATDIKVIKHMRELLKKPDEGSAERKAVPDLTYGHSVLMNVVYEKYDLSLIHI